jgi:hypothetical protein
VLDVSSTITPGLSWSCALVTRFQRYGDLLECVLIPAVSHDVVLADYPGEQSVSDVVGGAGVLANDEQS